MLSYEKKYFRLAGADIEAQAKKGRYARAPWNTSPSLWKSALQKAIRRGEREKAAEAAAMLMLIPASGIQSNLMNRLRTILLEDIGIWGFGMLPLADRLLSRAARARDAFFRGAPNHDDHVMEYRQTILELVDRMATAPRKTRLLSHALGVFAKPSSAWVHARFPQFDLSAGSLKEELATPSIVAIDSVYKYYENASANFPAAQANQVFDTARRAAPSRARFIDVLQRWFRGGYSENELNVYSAVLVAVFRDADIFQAPARYSVTLPVLGVFRTIVAGGAPIPLDVAYDMHSGTKSRGKVFFAGRGAVVIPEVYAPTPLATLMKKAYLCFKASDDPNASQEDLAALQRVIGAIPGQAGPCPGTAPTWPPMSQWKGQIVEIDRLIESLIDCPVRAQRATKSAKTLICRVEGIPERVFFKGPFTAVLGWNTQAYLDFIKPLFGLNRIGVIRVATPTRRDLFMRDLNNGAFEVDAEGVVIAASARALRASEVCRQGPMPDLAALTLILLFRAAWGVSDANANNILYDKQQKKWYSVDENVMFAPKTMENLRDKYYLASHDHLGTRPVSACLKSHKVYFCQTLKYWLSLVLPVPPAGSLEQFRDNVLFLLEHYDQLRANKTA